MNFVENHFPNGFRKKSTSGTTPRVRFDAIAVGCWMALSKDKNLQKTGPRNPTTDWLYSDDFFTLTTSSAANVRSRIENRMEYVMYMILGDINEARKRAPGGSDQE
jgi:hypothetical protein